MEPVLKIGKVKYQVILLVLTVISAAAFAETDSQALLTAPPKTRFSAGTSLTYLNGQYREIVYPPPGWESPYYSELLWNLKNVFMLNFSGTVSKGPWALDIDVGTAVTEGTGIMEDFDWGDYTTAAWTNWSRSLIYINKSTTLDMSLAYSWEINSLVSFPVQTGYKLNYFDWEDRAGEYIYKWNFITGSYYDPWETGSFGGVRGIDYKVIQNIFYLGTGILLKTEKVKTRLSLKVSPYVNSWDLDHHILRGLYFLDTFTSNFWYRLDLSLEYKIKEKDNISLFLYIEELPETAGDTYQYSSDPEEGGTQTGYYPDGAGTASLMWGIGISYIRTF